ncbi:uncharacterized protein TNCV_462901 [Trichonephila clavipes]|nr:uncharacterized protein TNCV_462901 [Trichonephila clavipes]
MPVRRRRSHIQQLTEFERDHAIGLREGGFSFRVITERLGRHASAMHDFWEQWSRDGTASRTQGPGRLRDTTEREDHRTSCTSVARRTAFAAEIRVAVDTAVIQRTVRNRLLQGQLRARSPAAWYSNEFKAFPLAISVVSNQSSLEDGEEICCIF